MVMVKPIKVTRQVETTASCRRVVKPIATVRWELCSRNVRGGNQRSRKEARLGARPRRSASSSGKGILSRRTYGATRLSSGVTSLPRRAVDEILNGRAPELKAMEPRGSLVFVSKFIVEKFSTHTVTEQ